MEIYSGSKKKDLSTLAFDQPDTLPVETTNSSSIRTTKAEDEIDEIRTLSCINCGQSDHNIEDCENPLINTELNGNDP
uniref:CCHC-type domain-containing protein n=1 Tax=Acrobeloides nanus TaxID=290746 RepID=A0A914DNR6_9BILA